MNFKHHTLFIKISSIIFFLFTGITFLMAEGYLSPVYWIYLGMSGYMSYFLFSKMNQKKHRQFILLIVAHQIVNAFLIIISFIETPIAFDNTEQIIFTVTLNLSWVALYIYHLSHQEQEDIKDIFYIVTLVLFIYKIFSNSIRIIALVRGYLDQGLSRGGSVLLIMLTVLTTLSYFVVLFLYRYSYQNKNKLN
ncbi:hypothetical protein KHQ89_03510 [Mycoplasmatota bacterium]|nr:hypothetical protein KHQ89_03510 [Mycoplasmatota bacterium]